MPVPASWARFERIVDGFVDGRFGEQVQIWPTMEEQAATGTSTPDPSRKVLYATGVVEMPGASATGEAGTLARGLTTEGKIETSMIWVSMTEDELGGDWTHYGIGDRVLLPERSPTQWYQINSITPSVTGRYNVNLVRVNE
jgi:hypothetical protein